ncbi:hypothetical protein [Mycobacterium sp. ACS1612]|uniref:hypothetical protein n=1 Tax=Mycobacterium sp. ACS1612 TaxID=1834117 RepID=UPI000832A39B|nr:hypothetical protein [Mycobacterium sp. ACS1612]
MQNVGAAELDYPTEGLAANRSDSGWSVYTSESDDQKRPLERPKSLVSDTGAIEQVSVHARAFGMSSLSSDGALPMHQFGRTSEGDDGGEVNGGAAQDSFTSEGADLIGQQLISLAPDDWLWCRAEFALTVADETAYVGYETADGRRLQLADVPDNITALVREQLNLTAVASAGSWWRLVFDISNEAEIVVGYDYGDDPFPGDQLQPTKNYLDDMAACRAATPMDDLAGVHDMWARWPVLGALHMGVESEEGLRVTPGLAWYESETPSGATLVLLPGDLAVLLGGWSESPLLTAGCSGDEPMPVLFAGAPVWVNEAVLNIRCQHGLLSFWYSWAEEGWWRGATDTYHELQMALPAVWGSADEATLVEMAEITQSARRSACASLLTAAIDSEAAVDEVIDALSGEPNRDLTAALNQSQRLRCDAYSYTVRLASQDMSCKRFELLNTT